MNYVSYWNLRDKPFENTRNSRYFFDSPEHGEALERMLYLVRDGNMGFGLLTGEIGSGKTMTRTVLKNRLSPSKYEVVEIEAAAFPFSYILLEIISQFKNEKLYPSSASFEKEFYFFLKEFSRLLDERIIKRNKHLILIFDEAQQLTRESLIELKNLTNLSSEDRNYITIILVGQPELRQKVKSLPQLDQRISLRYHLGSLNEVSVSSYLRHRLVSAGHPTGELFSSDGVEMIYQETNGIPREINRICKLALDRSFSVGAKNVEVNTVDSIINDIHKQDGAY